MRIRARSSGPVHPSPRLLKPLADDRVPIDDLAVNHSSALSCALFRKLALLESGIPADG